MKLYKYRSLSNLNYVLDIIFNERLYCSSYDRLNDPLEGVFVKFAYKIGEPFIFGDIDAKQGNMIQEVFNKLYPNKNIYNKFTVDDISNSEPIFVTCLSNSLSDIRLWSYYADGHKGIAIEIDFDNDKNLKEVTYCKNVTEYGNGLLSDQPKIDEVLTRKLDFWSYESEYRIINNSQYYSIKGKISRIFTGIRTSEEDKQMLSKVIPSSVELCETKLSTHPLEICPTSFLFD